MIVAVTGHRPDKFPGGYERTKFNRTEKLVKDWLSLVLDGLQPEKVLTGMALGVDQWMAEVCIAKGNPFVAAVPFAGQESIWPDDSQQHYRDLLAKACEVVVVSPGSYHPDKMQVRNRWLVEHSGALVAVFDGSPGGTKRCHDYAKSRNKLIVRPPETFWAYLNM